MTKPSGSSPSSSKSIGNPWRLIRYLVLGIGINAGIWSLTFFYLTVTKPTYVSKWTLVLPSTGTDTQVNIPGLGGASSRSTSPFSDRSQDPRSKYTVIAKSDAVLDAAAKKLNMAKGDFGQPRIRVVDNATLMDFEMKGDTPKEARNKALALQESLENKLAQLRREEVELKSRSFKNSVDEAKQRLDATQKRLSEFKAQTGLGSQSQLEQISDRIEELRKQLADSMSQKQQASANFNALSNNLNLSAKQASEAFILQTDPLFQQHLRDYSDATTTLTVLNSRFLPDNPAVERELSKQASARDALLSRSQTLLGRSTTLQDISQINLNGGPNGGGSGRDTLLQQLVQVQADAQGREASTRELSNQIAALEARYKVMTQNALTLETLERDARIAETIFSSALTALDVGASRADSYPPLQMMIQPNLPSKATSPKKSFAFLGAGLGTVFISGGLLSLWLRPYLLRKYKASKTNSLKSPEIVVDSVRTTAQIEDSNLSKRESYNGTQSKGSGQEELQLERR